MSYSDLLASPSASLYRLENVRRKTAMARWMDTKPLHEGQQAIRNHPARFKVVACGRRWGKTEGSKRIAVEEAMLGKYIWWISPDYTVVQDVWEELKNETQDIRSNISISRHTLYFPNGGRLRIRSGHEPNKLRGSGLDGVVMDEAAFCDPLVWEVVRPALSDKLGWALLLSTPNGRNWFWHMFQMGLDPSERDWACWQMPSVTNPFLLPSEIEDARRSLPERRFKEEYLAEFLDDGGAVFRNLAACFKPTTPTGGPYVLTADWGRHNDYTVLTVMDRPSKQVVDIDRYNQIGWTVQRGRLMAMAEKWKPEFILAESNSIGEPNIEQLNREGLLVSPFLTTNASKAQIIDDLALAFEQNDITIEQTLEYAPVLRGELEAFELERLKSGLFRYSAPPGGHDDMVISLALANYACGLGGSMRKVKLAKRGR